MFIHRNTEGKIDIASSGFWEGVAEEEIADDAQELLDFLNPPPTPLTSPLSPDQFYSMLEIDGKLDSFTAAIETVTPTSKKLTCRNQFNNSQQFTWDMILVTLVAPKVYGVNWQTVLGPIWINAFQTLDAGTVETQ